MKMKTVGVFGGQPAIAFAAPKYLHKCAFRNITIYMPVNRKSSVFFKFYIRHCSKELKIETESQD